MTQSKRKHGSVAKRGTATGSRNHRQSGSGLKSIWKIYCPSLIYNLLITRLSNSKVVNAVNKTADTDVVYSFTFQSWYQVHEMSGMSP